METVPDFIFLAPKSLQTVLEWGAIALVGLKKIRSVTVSIVSLPVCHEVIGLDAMILVF